MSRYFYESGAIRYTIKKDEQILKARDILNNKDEYISILNGTAGAILVTRKSDQAVTKMETARVKKIM